MFVDVFKLGPVMKRLMLSIKLKDRFGFRYNSIKKRERQLAPNTSFKPNRVKIQAELYFSIPHLESRARTNYLAEAFDPSRASKTIFNRFQKLLFYKGTSL